MMNLKLKAAAITAGVLGGGAVVGFILNYLPNWAVAVIALTFACYVVYNIALSGLKFDQAVDEINKKYQK